MLKYVLITIPFFLFYGLIVLRAKSGKQQQQGCCGGGTCATHPAPDESGNAHCCKHRY